MREMERREKKRRGHVEDHMRVRKGSTILPPVLPNDWSTSLTSKSHYTWSNHMRQWLNKRLRLDLGIQYFDVTTTVCVGSFPWRCFCVAPRWIPSPPNFHYKTFPTQFNGSFKFCSVPNPLKDWKFPALCLFFSLLGFSIFCFCFIFSVISELDS